MAQELSKKMGTTGQGEMGAKIAKVGVTCHQVAMGKRGMDALDEAVLKGQAVKHSLLEEKNEHVDAVEVTMMDHASF